MAIQENFVRTASELERKYNLSQLPGIQKAVELNKQGLNKTENTLNNFIIQTTGEIEEIQKQVDGNITTWFYSGVPTLDNYPANEWIEEKDKNNHLGDLYYDRDTGYAYRFTLTDETYLWLQLSDSDIAEALAVANDAKDTADSKRRVFVTTPTIPYDEGDLWLTDSKELFRCAIGRKEGEYVSTDWIVATKYTDDSYANTIAGNLTEFITITAPTTYETREDFIQKTGEIDLKVSKTERVAEGKNKVFTSEPVVPYHAGDVYLKDYNTDDEEIWVAQVDRLEGFYTESDWVLQESYSSSVLLKLQTDNLSTEVKTKVGENEIVSKINQSAEQVSIDANKINLNGIVTANDNFKILEDGSMEAKNGKFNGNINVVDNGDTDVSNCKVVLTSTRNNVDRTCNLYSTGIRFETPYNDNFTNSLSINLSNGIKIINAINGEKYNSLFLNKNGLQVGIEDSYESYETFYLQPSSGLFFEQTRSHYAPNYCTIDGNLNVYGDSWANHWYTNSKEELKKNFEEFENGLDVINKTKIYKYHFKTDEDNTKKHIGFVIGDNYKYSKDLTNEDNDAVDIYSMVSVCFKAIQEQQTQIEELKKEIKELKK